MVLLVQILLCIGFFSLLLLRNVISPFFLVLISVLYVNIFDSQIQFFASRVGRITYFPIVLSMLLTAVVFIAQNIILKRKSLLPVGWCSKYLLLFFLWIIIASFLVGNFKQNALQAGGIALVIFIAFFVSYNIVSRHLPNIIRITYCIHIAGIVYVCYALLPIILPISTYRIFGMLCSSGGNTLGQAIMIILPITIAFGNCAADKSKKAYYYITSVITFLLLCTTYSRASIVGVGIAMAILILYREMNKKLLIVSVILFFIAVGIFLKADPDSLIYKKLYASQNLDARIGIWHLVFESTKENFIFGRGYRFEEGTVIHVSGLPEYRFAAFDYHNGYLRVMHAIGIPGLLLYLASMGSWFWEIIRRLNATNWLLNKQYKSLLVGILSTVAGLAARNMFESSPIGSVQPGGFYTLLYMGLGLALARKAALRTKLKAK